MIVVIARVLIIQAQTVEVLVVVLAVVEVSDLKLEAMGMLVILSIKSDQ